MIESKINNVISRVSIWQNAGALTIEKIGGLTNSNFKVNVGGQSFALRICGESTQALGIDRINERIILKSASAAGLCPEVLDFLLPEGHLVTRWMDGVHWMPQEYRSPENVRRLTRAVKRIHDLPDNGTIFSPFHKADNFIQKIDQAGSEKPQNLWEIKLLIQQIKEDQKNDLSPWKKVCHNDLFANNYLIGESEIFFLDWEFAGMSDIYFDLATLVYTHDSDGPISRQLEEEMLDCYFEEITDQQRKRLAGMKFMLMLFNGLWGYLQNALLKAALIPAPLDFDYLDYGQSIFQSDLSDCARAYQQFIR